MTRKDALLIAADVARLYRTLSAAGVHVADLDLPLSHDTTIMGITGFCLIRRAMEQQVPQAHLYHEGAERLSYCIRTPALCKLPYDRRDIDQRMQDYCRAYDGCIELYRINMLRRFDLRLTIDPWILREDWYASHSLSGLWHTLQATVATVLRLEAEQRETARPEGERR